MLKLELDRKSNPNNQTIRKGCRVTILRSQQGNFATKFKQLLLYFYQFVDSLEKIFA